MTDRIKKLNQLLIDSPKDSFLLHALALEQLKINEVELAISNFESLLTHNPNYVGSYYHLAHAYLAIDKLNQANEVFEKGMTIAKEQNDMHSYGELKSAWEAQQDW